MTQKNKPLSEEHKKKIALAQMGEKNHWYGKKASEETKLKMSIAHKKRKVRLGYINSPESRKKQSDIMKNKWAKGDVSEKQKMRFHDGKAKGGFSTRFTKESRAKLIMPKFDTSIEIKIQNFLKELNIEFYTHQYIKDIEHAYQCDIYIPNLNLIVECDGNYFHNFPFRTEIDNIRTKELIEKGYKVLRLWESEIRKMDILIFKEKLEEENGL